MAHDDLARVLRRLNRSAGDTPTVSTGSAVRTAGAWDEAARYGADGGRDGGLGGAYRAWERSTPPLTAHG
jgi:hypothetical protein